MLQTDRNRNGKSISGAKSLVLAFLTGLLLCGVSGGCATSYYHTSKAFENQYAPEGYQAVANAYSSNCGYYLFNCIPLITGSVSRPNRMDYKFFRNTVTPADNLNILCQGLKRYDVDALGLVKTTEYSYGYFSLWLVWLRRVETTAVGLKQNHQQQEQNAQEVPQDSLQK